MFDIEIKKFRFENGKYFIDDDELASLIARKVVELTCDFDDAGADWCTTSDGAFILGFAPEWLITDDPKTVSLVEARNHILGSADRNKLKKEEL
jgi:hypothetical protein